MAAPTITATAPAHHQPWYQHLYVQVLVAIVLGILLGHFYPSIGAQHEAARRHLHQADQDADRADHLLHGGARHRQHGGHEEGRPGRLQGAALFRGHDHDRADHRPGRRQPLAARRRHEHRSRRRSTPRRSPPTPPRPASRARVEFLLHIIPATVVGAFAEGEILQVLFFAILFAFALHWLGETRQAAAAHHRPDRARLLRHRRHHHEGGPDRRLRRHGVHHRQVRRRHAPVAGLADGGLLRHLPDLRLRRARARRLAVRLLASSSSSATSRRSC